MIGFDEVKRVEAGADRMTAGAHKSFAESTGSRRAIGVSSANENPLKRLAQEKGPKVLLYGNGEVWWKAAIRSGGKVKNYTHVELENSGLMLPTDKGLRAVTVNKVIEES